MCLQNPEIEGCDLKRRVTDARMAMPSATHISLSAADRRCLDAACGGIEFFGTQLYNEIVGAGKYPYDKFMGLEIYAPATATMSALIAFEDNKMRIRKMGPFPYPVYGDSQPS